MKKYTALVVTKFGSRRVPGKNTRLLGGSALINHTIRTLNRVPEVSETIVFGSDSLIERSIDPGLAYRFVERPKWLDGDEVTAGQLLQAFIDTVSPEYVVQLWCTHPFIKPETLSDMIKHVDGGEFDSAIALVDLPKGIWLRERPFTLELMDEMAYESWEDLSGKEPVLLPVDVRVFHADLHTKHRRKIGFKPYLRRIAMAEGLDINTIDDWHAAEAEVSLADKSKPAPLRFDCLEKTGPPKSILAGWGYKAKVYGLK